jgi:hypothetical protein
MMAVDRPDFMRITQEFWGLLRSGKMTPVISSLVAEELAACAEPKQSVLLGYIGELDFMRSYETDEIRSLAGHYLSIMPQKYYNDCRHIALATVSRCEYMVTWDFRPLSKDKRLAKINSINSLCDYSKLRIVPPLMMLTEEDK